MSDEILADVPREGAIQPEDTEEITPESPTENDQTDESSASSAEDNKQDEKANLPFHEDPKIQEYINRQVEKRLDEGLKELEPFKEMASKFSPKEEIKVPPYWNGDADSYQVFVEDQRRIAAEEADNRVKALRQESETEAKRIREANDWFESNVSEIESVGSKVDRNKLLKKAMDEGLIDANGRWHYKAAWKLLQAEEHDEPTNKDARKRLAAVTESKAEPQPRDFRTPEDFKRKRPW